MENTTKTIYHRVKVNKGLLDFDPTIRQIRQQRRNNALKDFFTGREVDVLPKGKLKGAYFISYANENSSRQNRQLPPAGGGAMAMPNIATFLATNTDIVIEDSKGVPITKPTDIRDYDRKSWDCTGYKKIDFNLEHNEQIAIRYETVGDGFPICGEFIFVIEEEKVC